MLSRDDLRTVHVVIPAHDEEERIRACLDSVTRASGVLTARRPWVSTSVTVVLDRCRDATAAIAGDFAVHTVSIGLGRVGGARRAGVSHVVRCLGQDPAGFAAGGVLVVNTDADCVVPPSWLLDHHDLAADHDLVQGEVHPHPGEMSRASMVEWVMRNPPGTGSLHGANLSFRLDTYQAAGGFPDVCEQEDLLLVRAMLANGAATTGGTTVSTSGRREGRIAGGFSGYLRQLDLDLAASSGPP